MQLSKPELESVQAPEPKPGQSLTSFAYEELRKLISDLALEPGVVTSDSALARRLNISRTPIREAVGLLERDQLVSRIPNQGVLIRPVSANEFLHLAQMREMIDGLAARLAATRIEEATLDILESDFLKLAKRQKKMDLAVHSELSRKLHGAIVAASGNPYLQDTWSRLTILFDRARKISWRYWGDSSDQPAIEERRYKEHLEIIAALRKHDPDLAEEAARSHLSNSARDSLAVLR